MTSEVINLTLAAEEFIAEILEKNPEKLFKISVNNKGCAGHKYQYDLITADEISAIDEVITRPWGKVIVDAASVMLLLGSTLNLKEDLFNAELVWYNPIAQSTCGCGSSFSTSKETCTK